MTLSPMRLGLALAALLGGIHALWATAVGLGVAQPFLDFILRIHFLDFPMRIAAFDDVLAITLVLVTAAIGFVSGYAFGVLFNWMQSERKPSRAPHATAR